MAVGGYPVCPHLPLWAVSHATVSGFSATPCANWTRASTLINLNCGMLLLTCISLDRYIAIVQATKSFRPAPEPWLTTS